MADNYRDKTYRNGSFTGDPTHPTHFKCYQIHEWPRNAPRRPGSSYSTAHIVEIRFDDYRVELDTRQSTVRVNGRLIWRKPPNAPRATVKAMKAIAARWAERRLHYVPKELCRAVRRERPVDYWTLDDRHPVADHFGGGPYPVADHFGGHYPVAASPGARYGREPLRALRIPRGSNSKEARAFATSSVIADCYEVLYALASVGVIVKE